MHTNRKRAVRPEMGARAIAEAGGPEERRRGAALPLRRSQRTHASENTRAQPLPANGPLVNPTLFEAPSVGKPRKTHAL